VSTGLAIRDHESPRLVLLSTKLLLVVIECALLARLVANHEGATFVSPMTINFFDLLEDLSLFVY
jgi:hypothetical protein